MRKMFHYDGGVVSLPSTTKLCFELFFLFFFRFEGLALYKIVGDHVAIVQLVGHPKPECLFHLHGCLGPGAEHIHGQEPPRRQFNAWFVGQALQLSVKIDVYFARKVLSLKGQTNELIVQSNSFVDWMVMQIVVRSV